jgi:hypothetical protein
MAAPAPESLIEAKQKLAVGIYVVRKANTDKTMRFVLHQACMQHNDTCTHITWEMSHNMTFKAAAYAQYSSHWYCLQPPGDWVLRGAMYDCVVAGGVPMVFHKQYAKYMPYADVVDYSDMLVQAPSTTELEAQGTDFIAHLQQLHAAGNATEKVASWHRIRRAMQYALNPDHYLITWHDRHVLHPMDDAFTFSMKALLRGLCKQPAFHSSLSSRCQQGETGRGALTGMT